VIQDEGLYGCNMHNIVEKQNIITSFLQVEQVKEFVYLGSMFTRDGKCDSDIERRVNAGNMVNGAYTPLWAAGWCLKRPNLLCIMECCCLH
jgi:hypothetical protein